MAAPRLRHILVSLNLLLLLVLQLSSLSAVLGQEADAEPLEFDPADESGANDWDDDDDAAQGLLGEIVSSIREQPVAQRTLLDSLVVWVLLNPREFVFGCACLLVPLFAVAIGSAYCMIRDMGAAARAAAEERREMQQLRAKHANTIAEEQADDGDSGAEDDEALGSSSKKEKKQKKNKQQQIAAATDGIKQRPRANSAARR
jgi:hypothetical protein